MLGEETSIRKLKWQKEKEIDGYELSKINQVLAL